MTPAGLSENKGSCPQGWTRWPPASGAANPESTKRREPLENKANLGEVSPEERDTESSEAGSQVSQGSSDPEDNKIPLQPSAPWSEASNRQFSLTPPSYSSVHTSQQGVPSCVLALGEQGGLRRGYLPSRGSYLGGGVCSPSREALGGCCACSGLSWDKVEGEARSQKPP